jgi:predicted negative regulator of RcsB-dependent stress response
MTAEQQDHAVALWLLWKQHHKTQQRQAAAQQQEEQQQPSQTQPHNDCPDRQQTAPAVPGGMAADFSSLALADPADAADSDSSDLGQAAAAFGRRMYSRDEVAQMLVENKLTGGWCTTVELSCLPVEWLLRLV